jgi:hypothetical protein
VVACHPYNDQVTKSQLYKPSSLMITIPLYLFMRLRSLCSSCHIYTIFVFFFDTSNICVSYYIHI